MTADTPASAILAPADDPRRSDINIRSSRAFNGWAARLAGDQRVSVARLIEHALIDYAHRVDFDEEAPIRLSRDVKHAGED